MNRWGLMGVRVAAAIWALSPVGVRASEATASPSEVLFTSKDSRYTFQVSVDAGAPCTTPCAQTVRPGLHHVTAEGSVTIERDIQFPVWPREVVVDPRLRLLVADPEPTPRTASEEDYLPHGVASVVVQVAVGGRVTLIIDGVPHEAPCQIDVAPGPHLVEVDGPEPFGASLDFPAWPVTLKVEQHQKGMRKLGLTGVGVGGMLAVVGGVVTALGTVAWQGMDPCRNDDGICYNTSWYFTGFIITALGVSALASGVILAALLGGIGFAGAGQNRLSLEAVRGAEREATPAVRLVGLGAAPLDGGAILGASFVF